MEPNTTNGLGSIFLTRQSTQEMNLAPGKHLDSTKPKMSPVDPHTEHCIFTGDQLPQ